MRQLKVAIAREHWFVPECQLLSCDGRPLEDGDAVPAKCALATLKPGPNYSFNNGARPYIPLLSKQRCFVFTAYPSVFASSGRVCVAEFVMYTYVFVNKAFISTDFLPLLYTGSCACRRIQLLTGPETTLAATRSGDTSFADSCKAR